MRFSIRIFVFFLMGLCLLWLVERGASAQAQNTNTRTTQTATAKSTPVITTPEGAARLRSIFETFIEKQKRTFVPALGVSLIYDGRVSVEQTRTYYAITLPDMKILYKDGRVLDIGMISVNAIPDRAPARWRIAAAMPTPMIMRDSGGQVLMRIMISEQKSMGIWDERIKGFINFDSRFTDVSIDGGQFAYGAKIPELKARYDFSDNAIRLLIGDAVFELILGNLSPEK
jgi:hypothetical protein